jgi:hypothetical protein
VISQLTALLLDAADYMEIISSALFDFSMLMLWHAFLFLGLSRHVWFSPPFSFLLIGGFHCVFCKNILFIYIFHFYLHGIILFGVVVLIRSFRKQ